MQESLAYSSDGNTPQNRPPVRSGDAVSRINALALKARSRPSQGTLQASKIVVQLSLWDESERGVPNAILRSALFGVTTKGARVYMERQKIHSLGGIQMIYTGVRLGQGDLDVWETILHVARLQAWGEECRVTAYQLLKILGKTDTGKNRDVLDNRLSRMKATGLEIEVGNFSYEGSLIDEVYREKDSCKYVIRLNPKFSHLFAVDQFTKIDWRVRRELDGKPLAQWLHGFFATHAKPFPMKGSSLLKLSGSENAKPRSSNQKLFKALDALAEAYKTNGQSFSYEVRGDLVHVVKPPSKSQRRHLAKEFSKP